MDGLTATQGRHIQAMLARLVEVTAMDAANRAAVAMQQPTPWPSHQFVEAITDARRTFDEA